MIMSLAVLAGLIAGLTRAWIGKRRYQSPNLRHLWLILTGMAPQAVAFHLPGTRDNIPAPAAAATLVSSQALLLAFAALNSHQPGIKLAGLGAGLNLAVILANGGWMPVSPETVRKIWLQVSEEAIQPGKRLGRSKDLIQLESKTRLAFLSDRFVISFLKNRYAFSLGDLFIALGVFIYLWSLGGSKAV